MSKDNINERIKNILCCALHSFLHNLMVKVQITIKSITQDQLLLDLGQEIIKSLSRKMNEATFEASCPNKSIQNASYYLFTSRRSLRRQCQHQTGLRNAHRTRLALKWCWDKATKFRVNERRKVIIKFAVQV